MSFVTASGRLSIGTCEVVSSTVVAPARAAIARSASGGIAWSFVATTYQDGMLRQAGTPDGVPSAEASSGRWPAAITWACDAGRSAAKTSRKNAGST